MPTKIERLDTEFRLALQKVAGIQVAGYALIALLVGWGRPVTQILLIFVGTAVLLGSISLLSYIIPNRLKHVALLEKYGEDYADLALEAISEVGVIWMIDNGWFFTAERTLKDQLGPD